MILDERVTYVCMWCTQVESLWSGGGVSGAGELMWLQRAGPSAAPLPAPIPTPIPAPLPTPLPAPTSSDARLPQLPLYFWEHQVRYTTNWPHETLRFRLILIS